MTHRDRVMLALNHKQPDREPMDLGSFTFSSINKKVYDDLKNIIGIKEETLLTNRFIQSAYVSFEVLKYLETDFRPIYFSPRENSIDIESSSSTYIDNWGVERFMPEHGYYYDQKDYPLAGDISADTLKKYPWPDPDDPAMYRGMRERAEKIKEENEYAITFNPGIIFVHWSQFLRGYEDWNMDILADQELFGYLCDCVLEYSLEICSRGLDEVGDLIDVIGMSDDFATQTGMLISPDLYRKMIKPRHKRYFDMIRSKTNAKLLFHSCGAIESIIGDLIDIGVDIINPVQVSANNMDPTKLKRNYGKDICFWGGIDTQNILPYGSPVEVKKEVRRIIDILGEDGGYVLNSVHTIQPDVPVQNVIAMYEEGRKLIRV